MKKTIAILALTAALGACDASDAGQSNQSGDNNMKKIVQTAGRSQLGEFAPEFAHYNDDILFGENWNDGKIDTKTKSIVTVVSLMSQGIVDSSMESHLQNAKKNGVTRDEIVGIITHNAFYAGWPKAWAVFRMAKDIWADADVAPAATDKEKYQQTIMFPIGAPNDAYSQYFVGQSYLAPISTDQVKMSNVTFEPGTRNNWHIHHAATGGGQILIGVGGRGYYQQWGHAPVEINPGTVINIPAGIKHWHGAAPDSWFSHIAVEVDGTDTSNEWLEPVTDDEYNKLK